ncbi:hypothetical protein OH77DRAFT_1423560 [Trametes cingulata]|nr:hypothetical protein OH77DRAFT_1423560 [Trametes cingulata]
MMNPAYRVKLRRAACPPCVHIGLTTVLTSHPHVTDDVLQQALDGPGRDSRSDNLTNAGSIQLLGKLRSGTCRSPKMSMSRDLASAVHNSWYLRKSGSILRLPHLHRSATTTPWRSTDSVLLSVLRFHRTGWNVPLGRLNDARFVTCTSCPVSRQPHSIAH